MAHVYEPLNDPANQIRLAMISPSQDAESIIQCSVKALPLNLLSKYTALSCVYGDRGETQSIQVDGSTMKVPIEVEIALRCLRRADSKHLVWMEAICINHSDEQEKIIQVGILPKIHLNAHEVLAWTGAPKSTAKTDLVLNLLDQLAHETLYQSLQTLQLQWQNLGEETRRTGLRMIRDDLYVKKRVASMIHPPDGVLCKSFSAPRLSEIIGNPGMSEVMAFLNEQLHWYR